MKKIDWFRLGLEVVAALLLILTLTATIESNRISTEALKASDKVAKYQYLTGEWNDIMKEALNHPDFNDSSKTHTYSTSFTGRKLIQYDTYARWVCGYVEDLYYNKYSDTANNWDFFDPWIDDALSMHRAWIVDHKELYRHTESLYERIKKLPASHPQASGNALLKSNSVKDR